MNAVKNGFDYPVNIGLASESGQYENLIPQNCNSFTHESGSLYLDFPVKRSGIIGFGEGNNRNPLGNIENIDLALGAAFCEVKDDENKDSFIPAEI